MVFFDQGHVLENVQVGNEGDIKGDHAQTKAMLPAIALEAPVQIPFSGKEI